MPTKKSTHKTYTITEAAKKLGISRQAVHGALKKGLLEAKREKIVQTRIVKSTVVAWKIPENSLEAYRVSALHQTAGKKKLTDAWQYAIKRLILGSCIHHMTGGS